MTRSMLHHLGAALRVVGILVGGLALASFTVDVHAAAPASEWLRWFCVFGAAIALVSIVRCCASRRGDPDPSRGGARLPY